MVDVKNKRLVNSTTFESVKMSAAHVSGMHLTMAAGISDDFSKILASFPALTTPTFKESKVKHGVEMHIPTHGPPIHAKSRRLPPEKLSSAKSTFEQMEQMDVPRASGLRLYTWY